MSGGSDSDSGRFSFLRMAVLASPAPHPLLWCAFTTPSWEGRISSSWILVDPVTASNRMGVMLCQCQLSPNLVATWPGSYHFLPLGAQNFHVRGPATWLERNHMEEHRESKHVHKKAKRKRRRGSHWMSIPVKPSADPKNKHHPAQPCWRHTWEVSSWAQPTHRAVKDYIVDACF